jgi:cell division protein FtsQ
MTKRATRSAATRRPAAKKRAPARRTKQPSALDKALAALPVSEATLRRVATWGIVAAIGAAALGAAAWSGALAMAGTATAEVVGEAGFRLDKINIHGLHKMDYNTVYAQALDQKSRAMPLLDLAGVRARLLQYPYIQDARVQRRLPDALEIYIVEREPAAVWQNKGQLVLVDVHGVRLEPVSREAMPDLPLLIGDGANLQEAARRKLMDAAPVLKPLVKAATWVGNRRWDLIFDTGEKLQLPEGEDEAAKALIDFAEQDANYRLLGKGVISFDMRDSAKMVIRKAAASPPIMPVAQPDNATNASEGQE